MSRASVVRIHRAAQPQRRSTRPTDASSSAAVTAPSRSSRRILSSAAFRSPASPLRSTASRSIRPTARPTSSRLAASPSTCGAADRLRPTPRIRRSCRRCRTAPPARVWPWTPGHMKSSSAAGSAPSSDCLRRPVRLATYDGGNTPGGPFEFPGSVAVGPNGDVYVVDGGGSGRVERLSRAGASLGKLKLRGKPSAVAVNPVTGAVVVAETSSTTSRPFLEGFTVAGHPDVLRPLPGECGWSVDQRRRRRRCVGAHLLDVLRRLRRRRPGRVLRHRRRSGARRSDRDPGHGRMARTSPARWRRVPRRQGRPPPPTSSTAPPPPTATASRHRIRPTR